MIAFKHTFRATTIIFPNGARQRFDFKIIAIVDFKLKPREAGYIRYLGYWTNKDPDELDYVTWDMSAEYYESQMEPVIDFLYHLFPELLYI